MEFIYMLLPANAEWEDMILFTDEQHAIDSSIKYPNMRVEIFNKTDNGYLPTYRYIKNGEFIQN